MLVYIRRFGSFSCSSMNVLYCQDEATVDDASEVRRAEEAEAEKLSFRVNISYGE